MTRADTFRNEVAGQTQDTRAERNHVFVILDFEGPNRADAALQELRKTVAGLQGGPTIRDLFDTNSWLVDGKGARHDGRVAAVSSSQCKLVFSVPRDATALVWHDGETKRYQLEPVPKELVP